MIPREARLYIEGLHQALSRYEQELDALTQSNQALMRCIELFWRLAQREGWDVGVPAPTPQMTVTDFVREIVEPLQRRVGGASGDG